MNETGALAGYVFFTLALMFGGRRRRSFNEASRMTAAFTLGILCLAALTLFIAGSIDHIVDFVQARNAAESYTVQADDR
jgi:ABC-type cobalamin transport system permease subunit